MKNNCFVVLLILILSLSGCISSNANNQYSKDTAYNVTMSIKEGTLTNHSATIIIKDLSGKINIYGEDFALYKKIDNKWMYLTPKHSLDWRARGYNVDDNGLLEMNLSWDLYWGELQPGEYKIVKYVSEIDSTKSYSFSTNFNI